MFNELTHDQARHLVDIRQAFEQWEDCRDRLAHSYAGSMRWAERKGYVYLLKKTGDSERSLGRRDRGTEATYWKFVKGRDEARARLQALDGRLEALAPVARALRLNRLPLTAARVLRHLGDAGLLGHPLLVVGTTALYLYESMAAVQLESGLLATTDMDLLWDARQALTLAGAPERAEGILGVLRRADRSFEPAARAPFRAVNRDGFMVDLIRPLELNPGVGEAVAPEPSGGLEAAEIVGLDWLVNVPKVDDIVVAHDGRPVRMSSVDPRVFALHKLWLAGRNDREPAKRDRDRAQAEAAAIMARRFGLAMADPALSALPAALRENVATLADSGAR